MDQTPAQPLLIIKSANDDLDYRLVTLPNGLLCALVSDPDTERSAVCLTVGRGSFDDPHPFPGLAHFLEHLLFMGSEDFPATDHYSEFVAQSGGECNAYTSDDYTSYHHSVRNEVS